MKPVSFLTKAFSKMIIVLQYSQISSQKARLRCKAGKLVGVETMLSYHVHKNNKMCSRVSRKHHFPFALVIASDVPKGRAKQSDLTLPD